MLKHFPRPPFTEQVPSRFSLASLAKGLERCRAEHIQDLKKKKSIIPHFDIQPAVQEEHVDQGEYCLGL